MESFRIQLLDFCIEADGPEEALEMIRENLDQFIVVTEEEEENFGRGPTIEEQTNTEN